MKEVSIIAAADSQAKIAGAPAGITSIIIIETNNIANTMRMARSAGPRFLYK